MNTIDKCPHCSKAIEQTIEIVDGLVAIANAPAAKSYLYKQYKIRRKTDGMYSSGGASVKWDETGKVWNTLQGVSIHLTQHKGDEYGAAWNRRGIPWNDIEIVSIEVIENKKENIEAQTYVKELRERAAKKRKPKVDRVTPGSLPGSLPAKSSSIPFKYFQDSL